MPQLIDLTHDLANGMPVWPGHPVFEQRSVASFAAGDIACNHSLHLSEHCGTHFDAPLISCRAGRPSTRCRCSGSSAGSP